MSVALVRPVSSTLWELRAAWATGQRVALSLDERCDPPRIEGWVTRVAATGAFVCVGPLHIPAGAVLAVHSPSRLGDSDHEKGPWRGRARRWEPQAEQLGPL